MVKVVFIAIKIFPSSGFWMLFYEASATDGKKISYPFFSSQKAIFTHLFGKIYMEIEFSPNIGNKPY